MPSFLEMEAQKAFIIFLILILKVDDSSSYQAE